METVKFIDGEKLTVLLNGRIDSTNAPEVQKIIEEKLAEANCTAIIVDADNLEYISSAGLRVLMVMKKKIKDMTMINVSRDVYEILDMTGFVTLFEVKKALRKISVDNLEVIGKGTCGTVYRIDAETVVKVFNPGFDINIIELEKTNAQKAFINGIDTAISFDMVRVGDQIGLVYEMLDADTFKGIMKKNPDKKEEYITIYAEFLKTIHGIQFEKGELSEKKPNWISFIDKIPQFSDDERIAVRQMLESVPDANTFTHGDYNVGNVMYVDGKAILIDMESISVGHPIFDLAGVYLGFKLFPMLIPEEYCEQMTGFNKADNDVLWNQFCKIYFATSSEAEQKEIEQQIVPFSAYRVLQSATVVSAFPEQMINYCKELLMGALKDGNHILKF